jgi:outer membrane protein
MKRYLKNLLAAAIVGLFTAQAAQAQVKIAVIDLQKVFDGFWRTKQADAQIKDRAAEFEGLGNKMLDDYKKVNDERTKLIDSSNDPAISGDEKDKRKKDVEKKEKEIIDLQNSIQTFRKNSQQSLIDSRTRLRDSILREIRGVIEEKAKAASFSLVIDTAAQSANQTPVIMYNTISGDSDLTEAVLKQLNANAPPEGTKSPDAKDDGKKDDKK